MSDAVGGLWWGGVGKYLEPGDVVGGVKGLGHDAAQGAEHGPASVDQLGLAVGREGLGIGGQAGGVPAVVTGELTGEVRGDLAGHGAEPLGAVRAVPLNRLDGGVDLGLRMKRTVAKWFR